MLIPVFQATQITTKVVKVACASSLSRFAEYYVVTGKKLGQKDAHIWFNIRTQNLCEIPKVRRTKHRFLYFPGKCS